MKEEEPVDAKKTEDDGIEKENLAVLEKIRKHQRQDHLNVSIILVWFSQPRLMSLIKFNIDSQICNKCLLFFVYLFSPNS